MKKNFLIEDLIRDLSSCKHSTEDLMDVARSLSDIAKEMDIPHVFSFLFLENINSNKVGNYSNVKGSYSALFEMFRNMCVSDDNLAAFFIAFGKTMEDLNNSGELDILRKATKTTEL